MVNVFLSCSSRPFSKPFPTCAGMSVASMLFTSSTTFPGACKRAVARAQSKFAASLAFPARNRRAAPEIEAPPALQGLSAGLRDLPQQGQGALKRQQLGGSPGGVREPGKAPHPLSFTGFWAVQAPRGPLLKS